MLEWRFWEQYSHEPYIAVARFQVAYLGKPLAELDELIVVRGKSALARLEQALANGPFLVGGQVSLADLSLIAYTRVVNEGGFELRDYPGVQAWIARTETALAISA